MGSKNLETWHSLTLLSHMLDIKRLQQLEIVIIYIPHKSTHLRINFKTFELDLANLN
jgi:hypothetical protein